MAMINSIEFVIPDNREFGCMIKVRTVEVVLNLNVIILTQETMSLPTKVTFSWPI